MKDPDKLNATAEDLYEELLIYCRGRVPPDDAYDITQDVFSAFTAEWIVRPVEYPRQWLYKVMKNKIADYYRQKERHDRMTAKSLDENITEDPDDGDNPDGNQDPAFSYEMEIDTGSDRFEETGTLAARILSHLDEDERKLYDDRYKDRLTYEQTAQREGMSVSAVRRRLNGIRKKLRSLIKKELE